MSVILCDKKTKTKKRHPQSKASCRKSAFIGSSWQNVVHVDIETDLLCCWNILICERTKPNGKFLTSATCLYEQQWIAVLYVIQFLRTPTKIVSQSHYRLRSATPSRVLPPPLAHPPPDSDNEKNHYEAYIMFWNRVTSSCYRTENKYISVYRLSRMNEYWYIIGPNHKTDAM